MSKRLMADGTTGKVCIMEGGSRTVFNAPRDNLDKIFFHSDLDYLTIVQQINLAYVSVPAVEAAFTQYSIKNKKSKGHTTYTVPKFISGSNLYNLGSIVGDPDGPILGFMDSQPLATYPLYWETQPNKLAFRTVSLVIQGSQVYLAENWMSLGLPVPEQTIQNVKIVKFNLMSDNNPNSQYKLLIKPDRFIASGGKLDSAARYVHKVDQGLPAPYSMYYKRTMDCRNGGCRWWLADGSYVDENDYNGAYFAPAPVGIEI